MAIAVATTRKALVSAYAGLGNNVGLASGDPGTSATPANELSGGSYARQPFTWGSPTDNGTQATAVGSQTTVNAPAGIAINYAFFAAGASSATMFDKFPITPTTLQQAGPLIVTPQYVQS